VPPLPPNQLLDGRIGATVQRTAEALDLHPNSVWVLISEGKLRASKLGRRTIVRVDSIVALMNATEIQPKRRSRVLRRHAEHGTKP
jgi:hypothetical protein